jgi:hypothetical protein
MVMICRAAAASFASESKHMEKAIHGGACSDLLDTSSCPGTGGAYGFSICNISDGRMPSLAVGMAGVYDVAKVGA